MKKRYSEEQIIGFLKEAESGVPIKELCRRHGFSEASFYTWRSKFGGMDVSDAKRLKALETENVNAYETGYRRFPVSVLPPLARYLGLTLDELVGETAQARKRGPTPKLQRQMELIQQLPKAKQRFVSDMLDTVIQQAG